MKGLVSKLHGVLKRDNGALLKAEYRSRERSHFTEGYCYIASEALYHKLGGQDSPWVPVRTEGIDPTHWWLEHSETGEKIDPTKEQYTENEPPYEAGKRAGFLTKEPSKRAKILLEKL